MVEKGREKKGGKREDHGTVSVCHACQVVKKVVAVSLEQTCHQAWLEDREDILCSGGRHNNKFNRLNTQVILMLLHLSSMFIITRQCNFQ